MPRITVFIILIFISAWLILGSPPKTFAEEGDWCGDPISLGSNFCCDSSGPKANNVCNIARQKQLDADGDCLEPYHSRLSYPHSCDWKPECCYIPPTPTATPTPAPTGVAACENNCGGLGPCGYRNSDRSCTINNSCCHRTCSGGSCITIAGAGTNACDTNNQCVGATPTATPTSTPTPTPTPTPSPAPTPTPTPTPAPTPTPFESK